MDVVWNTYGATLRYVPHSKYIKKSNPTHTHHILHTTKEQMTKRAAEKQIIKDGPNDDDDDGDVEQQSAQDTVDLSQRK